MTSIPGPPHSDEILMLKMEVFLKFVFIELSRSNVIENNIMVTSEAMLSASRNTASAKAEFPK